MNKYFHFLFIGLLLCIPGSLFAATTSNAEQSVLKEKLVQLERQVLVHTGQKSTNYIVPNSYVKTTKKVSTYQTPGAKKRHTVTKGLSGTVVGDLRLIGDEIWWNVQFSESVRGWVQEKNLERISSVSVNFDYNEDKTVDASVRLIGNYDSNKFVVAHERENAYMLVHYTGSRPFVTSTRVLASLATSSTNYSKTNTNKSRWALQWYVEGLPKDGYSSFTIETIRTKAFSGAIGGSVEGWKIEPDFITGLHYIDLRNSLTPDPGEYQSRVIIRHCGGYRPYGCGVNEEKSIATSNWVRYTINK